MPDFKSLDALAAHFTTELHEQMEKQDEQALEKPAAMVRDEAKRVIGTHYDYNWGSARPKRPKDPASPRATPPTNRCCGPERCANQFLTKLSIRARKPKSAATA